MPDGLNSTTDNTSNNVFDKIEDIRILPGPPGSFQKEEQTDTENSAEGEEQEEQEGEVNENDDNADSDGTEESTNNEETTAEAQEQDEDYAEISEEEVDSLIEQRFGGLSYSEIEQRLNRLEELEQKGVAPKFQSEKHQKAYDFITKYTGDDFNSGILRFSSLQSLDVEKMDPKSAMKELFYQKNPTLPREKADRMFEYTFNSQYNAIDDEEIAQMKVDLDGAQAKKELIDLQKETHATETQNQAQMNEEVRNNYLNGVDESLQDFDNIYLSGGDDPDADFTYEIEDRDLIRDSMSGVDKLYMNMGWMNEKGNFDFDKMKVDVAFLLNKEKILGTYFQRGEDLGKEKILREKQNMTPKTKKTEQPSQGGPKNKEEALMNAIMNHPKLR